MESRTIEHDPELSVVEAVQRGDSHGLAELMQRQGPWVRGVIFGALGRGDEVDDVAQRVWIQVWREADKLDDPARWRVWLYRIARNAATDAGRRTQRRRRLLTSLFQRDRGGASPAAEKALVAEEQRETML